MFQICNLHPPTPGQPAAGASATPTGEKPKAKPAVRKAPTMGLALHSDGMTGPAGNRNLVGGAEVQKLIATL